MFENHPTPHLHLSVEDNVHRLYTEALRGTLEMQTSMLDSHAAEVDGGGIAQLRKLRRDWQRHSSWCCDFVFARPKRANMNEMSME